MAGSPARRGWLAAAAAVLVLALAGGGYLLLTRNSDAPAPAALDAAPATTATTAGDPAQPASGTPDGAWQVRDDGSSFVGYRVRERLANLSSASEAVGRSTQVTGTMQVAGDQEPASGQQVNGQGKGRLTVHGVTREVTADLEGRWDGSTIQVAGRIPVRMTDFQIQPPQFGPVLSIEDSLSVDFRLTFVPA